MPPKAVSVLTPEAIPAPVLKVKKEQTDLSGKKKKEKEKKGADAPNRVQGGPKRPGAGRPAMRMPK